MPPFPTANSETGPPVDSHEDRTPKPLSPPAVRSGGTEDEVPPDYRAIARQFAGLSAAAARRARATGDGALDALSRRLDHCVEAMLDDLGHGPAPAPGPGEGRRRRSH